MRNLLIEKVVGSTKYPDGKESISEENFKMLLKEIKEDLKECTIWSWLGKLNLIEVSILPKLIHKFAKILIKLH